MTIAPHPAPKPRGMGPALKILFAVSLMANLAVAGGLIGIWLRQGEGPPPPSAMRSFAFGPYGEAMSRAQRKELARGFSQSHGDPRVLRDEMGREFAQIVTALRQVPLDEPALRAAMSRQQGRALQRLEDAQAALLAVILQMGDEDRVNFAQKLEDQLNRKRPNAKSAHSRD